MCCTLLRCCQHITVFNLFITNQLNYIRISYLSGVEVNQEQKFVVDTKGAGGQGHLEVNMVSFVS